MSSSEVSNAIATAVPEKTRNVSLIAHVDHGKTTFADCLLATNGVVSSRLAGKLKLLDSRADEQERGITMKASATSIVYSPSNLLINIVDSPGHIDFGGEVADALLLADTSLLLIDVVEGVRSQTEAVLRRALIHGHHVILVLNKIDRLRWELQMDESTAFVHLKTLIEAVNSCLSQVLRGLLLADESWGCIEEIEAAMHFSPSSHNVLFSSAAHSFAFSVLDFAAIYSPKMGVTQDTLTNSLFGDYYLSGKKICEGAHAKGKKTLFEHLVLSPLWQVLDAGAKAGDLPAVVEMGTKLGVAIKSRRAGEAMDELLRAWLPLPLSTFRLLARAPTAQSAMKGRRLRVLLGGDGGDTSTLVQSCDRTLESLTLVAKLIEMDGRRIGISRVFSGTLKKGDKLFARNNKNGNAHEVTVTGLWLLRGRDVVALEEVPAGVICGVEVEGDVSAMTTLSHNSTIPRFAADRDTDEPLVRVRIGVARLEDEEKLRESLLTLSLFDPAVRVREETNGELALLTAGEVHLEKCIQDLKQLGLSDLQVSSPIVPFLETTVADAALGRDAIDAHSTEARRGESLHLRLRLVPLPQDIAALAAQCSRAAKANEDMSQLEEKLLSLASSSLPSLKGSWWWRQSEEAIRQLLRRAWSFGPDCAPDTILLNAVAGYDRRSIWGDDEGMDPRRLDSAIVTGFELFVSAGPLAAERMSGVAVVVEEWKVDEEEPGISGQLIAAMRSCCTAAARKTPLRLVAAMYRCVVASSSTALGKVHGVLGQRKAKVTSEEVDELTGLFIVRSLLPVIESFSLSDTLRKKTSGLASAQVEWSHWEVIPEDPFWQPSTEEEIEEFGIKGDSPNHARGYLDAVRRRKGLPTEDLIVVSAEKQRNLKRNK